MATTYLTKNSFNNRRADRKATFVYAWIKKSGQGEQLVI